MPKHLLLIRNAVAITASAILLTSCTPPQGDPTPTAPTSSVTQSEERDSPTAPTDESRVNLTNVIDDSITITGDARINEEWTEIATGQYQYNGESGGIITVVIGQQDNILSTISEGTADEQDAYFTSFTNAFFSSAGIGEPDETSDILTDEFGNPYVITFTTDKSAAVITKLVDDVSITITLALVNPDEETETLTPVLEEWVDTFATSVNG